MNYLNLPHEGEERLPFEPPTELCYEAESPDEAALVYAARAYKCTLQSRTPDQVTVDSDYLGTLNFKLLHILPFDSVRKRMSVVVKHPLTEQIVVYTKGADSVIMDLLQMDSTGTDNTFMDKVWVQKPIISHTDFLKKISSLVESCMGQQFTVLLTMKHFFKI